MTRDSRTRGCGLESSMRWTVRCGVDRCRRRRRSGAAGGNGVRVVDAVKEGNVAAVKALIAQKADVNAAEPDGMTALHWAVRANDVPTVQMLLRAGANVNAASRYGHDADSPRRPERRPGRRGGAAQGRRQPEQRAAGRARRR